MNEKTAKNILDCIARSCGYSYSMFDHLEYLCFVNGKEDDMFDNDCTYIFAGECKEILYSYCRSYRDALRKLLNHLNAGNTVEYGWKGHKMLSKEDLYGTIKFEAALEVIDLDNYCLEV